MIVVHDVANGVGESPVWDDGVLRWVDITGRTVHALASDGTVSSHGTGDFPVFWRCGGAAARWSDCVTGWPTST